LEVFKSIHYCKILQVMDHALNVTSVCPHLSPSLLNQLHKLCGIETADRDRLIWMMNCERVRMHPFNSKYQA